MYVIVLIHQNIILEVKVVCTSKYTKKFVEDGEERSIASYCTHEEKTNFEGFPENG